MITITRVHEIAAGHRVYGHESRCARLHGHSYKFEITCTAPELDSLGRVVDFSVIKEMACQWLEDNWDHRMLLWDLDPILLYIQKEDATVVPLPFNPTAENLAKYFCGIADSLLPQGIRCIRVGVWETSKCFAEFSRRDD